MPPHPLAAGTAIRKNPSVPPHALVMWIEHIAGGAASPIEPRKRDSVKGSADPASLAATHRSGMNARRKQPVDHRLVQAFPYAAVTR
jgi:hypothetical protein